MKLMMELAWPGRQRGKVLFILVVLASDGEVKPEKQKEDITGVCRK